MCRAGCCGREARRQARARRNGLAEGVVQVAVDQAGLSHARLACAEERHEGGGGVRRPHSARAHSMQAAAAARRARRHPHRRSAAPRQRWPRVRAARRTKEHELQVDGLHRSPRSGRTGSASATWWLLRRQCRATRSAGWRGRRPTTGGTACPASGAAKTENACTFGAAPLQGCKAHGRLAMAANVLPPRGRHRATCASVAAKVRTKMLSVAKAMGKEALCAARPLHRGFARRLRATTALQRVRRRSPERRRERALVRFGTQGGWALEAWRLRSAPHYSASACACRPSPPASSRVQDQGHGHRAREAHRRGVQQQGEWRDRAQRPDLALSLSLSSALALLLAPPSPDPWP